MKKAFWKSDWFAALIISLFFLLAGSSAFLQSLERKAYDLGVQQSSRSPGNRIAIDDQSIANIGRWPWSREVHANMTTKLGGAQAKVIANTVYFLEPQIDPGLAYIKKMADFVATSSLVLTPEAPALDALLIEAQGALNTDVKLAEAIKAAINVVFGMPFTIGEPLGNPDNPLPPYVVKNALTNMVDRVDAGENGLLPIPTIAAISPIAVIGEAEVGIVKVTDFGIARITDSSKIKTGMVLGTPSYMSPEQSSGKKVDGRSDLFSLGVILYQMTTGQLPFTGDSMASLMFKIANQPHESAAAVNANISPYV